MKLLLYCTKANKQKDLLWSNNLKYFFLDGAYNRLIDDLPKYLLNGKIVAECEFEVEEIIPESWNSNINYWYSKELLKASCLDALDLRNYLKDNKGYAIHIKNLRIFDEPRELSDYTYFGTKLLGTLGNAPQNMMYAYDNEEKKILISIRPQWLCKILNGEKTIEVRKKVLKGGWSET